MENYILNWKYTCNDFIVENSDFFKDFGKFDWFQDKQEDVDIKLYIFTQSIWRNWHSWDLALFPKAPNSKGTLILYNRNVKQKLDGNCD